MAVYFGLLLSGALARPPWTRPGHAEPAAIPPPAYIEPESYKQGTPPPPTGAENKTAPRDRAAGQAGCDTLDA